MEIRTPTYHAPDGSRAQAAETWLADVADRLEQAKIEALLGVHYDADEFDRLVVEYRQAKRCVDSLRFLAANLSAFVAPVTEPCPLP